LELQPPQLLPQPEVATPNIARYARQATTITAAAKKASAK
jgi:hypothetical protein